MYTIIVRPKQTYSAAGWVWKATESGLRMFTGAMKTCPTPEMEVILEFMPVLLVVDGAAKSVFLRMIREGVGRKNKQARIASKLTPYWNLPIFNRVEQKIGVGRTPYYYTQGKYLHVDLIKHWNRHIWIEKSYTRNSKIGNSKLFNSANVSTLRGL